MSNWKTTMTLSYNDGCIITDQIKIQRGVFQGDSFSPLLSCLAQLCLYHQSWLHLGMVTRSKTQVLQSAICFCMDDLKLYSKNEQEQVGELKIVKQFHDDVRIEFGLEKCAIASFKKGRLTSTENIVIDKDTEIQELDQEGVNKYLGVDKSDGIQHSKMKEKIRKKYNRRVRLILRTELNGRNKIEAINSFAFSVVCVIDWKICELKKIDTKTRKRLNMHKILHPKADVERLYISGKDGGRGLIDVEAAFKSVTIGLNHYLRHKEWQYPKQVLGHERYKAKNSIARNATNFKREITARV